MFDEHTIALMAQAPALDGLDLRDLPRRLTNAYASIVAARITTRQNSTERPTIPQDTARTVAEMRRLAFALEALLSAVPERQDRAAAAFVAGTAHHVSLLAQRTTATVPHTTQLRLDGISPEVSATLLFLVAEATADAAEVSKAILVQTDDEVTRALMQAIQCLANGRLEQLLDADTPSADVFLQTNPANQGARSLYYMLLHGVRRMAELMLGREPQLRNGLYGESPGTLFEQVKLLSVDRLDDLPIAASDGVPPNLFPGPFHMASLLSAVSADLTPSAVINLPPPENVDPDRWAGTMRHIAQRRPYLWRNHREAIDAGYLQPGVSSVVNFPTGAGKSTLAELKVATTLLGGKRVVCLAPTLALVDQTATTLAKAFPNARVQRERAHDLLAVVAGDETPEVIVLTPERCLTLLSFQRELFENVGLLVFDECHLLHPRDPHNSRRAIDAMLCVLNFTMIAEAADLLFLSAMMMNAQDISDWITSLTGRKSLPLELTWKPTRQVRGCVVYATDEVQARRRRLREAQATTQTKATPAAVKRELGVRPLGLFCLRQRWDTFDRRDYALVPLLEEQVLLGTSTGKNGDWYLTPNGNQVAATIAAATAADGLKTLVFAQTIPQATATAQRASERLAETQCVLTPEEKLLYQTAVREAGDRSHLYLEVREDWSVAARAAGHHGLLLANERRLHESLFKRRDGISVLVATSTLAQGMNLPSEVVIIAGDRRFDPKVDGLQQLEAYELLNAAGRAGRAGENSYGLVLVIPSQVVYFRDSTNEIRQHWVRLQAIFAKSDACVTIEDPLTALLDEIHAASAPLSEMAEYMIRRLPSAGAEHKEDPDDEARDLLGRSLGAFFARRRKDEAWVSSRIEGALLARKAGSGETEDQPWARELAAAAGVSASVISALSGWLKDRAVREDASVCELRDAVFGWLEDSPELVCEILRPGGLEELLGRRYKELDAQRERGRLALPVLKRLLEAWMAGRTLAEIEVAYGTRADRLGKCETARKFVLRVVPELAYLYGLASQVIRGTAGAGDWGSEVSANVEALGSCVREGFDCVEKLALRWIRQREGSRVAVHAEFAELSDFVEEARGVEGLRALRRRVRRAVDAWEDGER